MASALAQFYLNDIQRLQSKNPALDTITRIASIMEDNEDRQRKYGTPEQISNTEPFNAQARGFMPQQKMLDQPVQGPANRITEFSPPITDTGQRAIGPEQMFQQYAYPVQPDPTYRTTWIKPATVGTEPLKVLSDLGLSLDPESDAGKNIIKQFTGTKNQSAFKKKEKVNDLTPIVVDQAMSASSGIPIGTMTTIGTYKEASKLKRSEIINNAQGQRQQTAQSFQATQTDKAIQAQKEKQDQDIAAKKELEKSKEINDFIERMDKIIVNQDSSADDRSFALKARDFAQKNNRIPRIKEEEKNRLFGLLKTKKTVVDENIDSFGFTVGETREIPGKGTFQYIGNNQWQPVK